MYVDVEWTYNAKADKTNQLSANIWKAAVCYINQLCVLDA